MLHRADEQEGMVVVLCGWEMLAGREVYNSVGVCYIDTRSTRHKDV